MFEKGVCEEIVYDDKLILVLSNDIIDAYVEGITIKNLPIKIPKIYIDKSSNNKDVFNFKHKFIIHRLHDCIDNQTFYIMSLYEKNVANYDSDFVQFIRDASKNGVRYVYDVFLTNDIYQKRIFTNVAKSRFIQIGDEVIFVIKLNQPINQEYLMNRDYRTQLNLIDIVSFLSDYKEELNTNDQEG